MTLEERITTLAAEVLAADAASARAASRRHDTLVKPPGSLGRLEDLGAQLAAIAGSCPPPVPTSPTVVVVAADHGVHAQAVTSWPQSITAAMVEQVCGGRACINTLAQGVGAAVSVLDVGVATPVAEHPRLRRAAVRRGTADLSRGPAMTREDAARALLAGAGVAEELVAAGCDLLVTGDLGIANTTASACLVAAFTGAPAEAVTGRGAGADDDTLARKIAVVAAALELHRPDPADPLGVLAAVGGLEHAALVGILLSAAADGVPVLLDGVIAGAAALAAQAFADEVTGYLVAGHRSPEPGAAVALRALGLEPLLDLQLRLGEGSGAVLAVPLVQAAARVLNDVAQLSDLGAPAPVAPGG